MKMPEIRRRRTWLEIRGGELVSDAGTDETDLALDSLPATA